MVVSYITENMISPRFSRTVHKASGLTFGLGPCGYDIRLKQDLIMWPGRFVLGSSVERFNMPIDMAGVVHDKSTLVRRGLGVFNTFIEPGWIGWLTLELKNHSWWRWIRLRAGQPIAQVVWHRVEGTTRPYRGKYHNQPDHPVKAIFEREPW